MPPSSPPPDDTLLSLADLAEAPRPRALVGGKAAGLARLMAAGVPVPPGLVLTTRATVLPAAKQDALLQTLAERARGLGDVVAVRSSATIEDDVAAAAPGIFVSRLGVSPADLAEAVRAVWASAQAPLVRAYARDRGIEHIDMAVVVQAQVGLVQEAQARGAGTAGAAGVAYTRPPGRPDAAEMLVETHASDRAPAAAARIPRTAADRTTTGDLPLDADTVAALVQVLLQAEDAIEAPRGADVEWVVASGDAGGHAGAARTGHGAGPRIWIVQARPIVHPSAAPAPGFPESLIQFSRAEPDVVWHWDVSHNPDPLSPAQAGLVERVDRAGLAPFRMRMVGGYLYTASAPADTAAAPSGPGLEGASDTDEAGSGGASDMDEADALHQRFAQVWRPAIEAALAAAEAPDADLATVLDAHDRFYAVYAGELTARVSRARRALPAFLRARGFDAPESLAGTLLSDRSPARLETLIARVARGEVSFDDLLAAAGPMSPAWDVAVPTYAENPALLRQAVEAAAARAAQTPPAAAPPAAAAEARVHAALDSGAQAAFARCLALARTARDIGEIDDRLYARAQAAVRHGLLRLARHWGLPDPDDIFYLPLDAVTGWASEHARPELVALQRMARAGRRARQRQRAWAMPLAFADGRAQAPDGPGGPAGPGLPGGGADSPAAPPDRDTWHGRGTGGRVRGTAVRVADLADIPRLAPAALGPDPILVVPAITPAMTILLQHAVAVVAEHGGLLGHGAAMARELGLPCVVACARAWQDLRTGDTLWLDGEAGLVVRTGHEAG